MTTKIYTVIQFAIFTFASMGTWGQSNTNFNLRIDHILIAVDNLDDAKSEYEKYGFTVVYGGKKETALNALIFLQDGTLIELIGKDRFPKYYTFFNKVGITNLLGVMKDRISMFRKVNTGLFNYCVYTSDISSTLDYLKSINIKCDRVISLTRKREDGVKIEWKLIGTSPYDLPFYINDYNPPRLSDSSLTIHKNGVVSLDTLTVETTDFETYHSIYNAIYRQDAKVVKVDSSLMAYYVLGRQTIVLKSAGEIIKHFDRSDESTTAQVTLRSNDHKGSNYYLLNDFIKIHEE